jgi:hypothetical protein
MAATVMTSAPAMLGPTPTVTCTDAAVNSATRTTNMGPSPRPIAQTAASCTSAAIMRESTASSYLTRVQRGAERARAPEADTCWRCLRCEPHDDGTYPDNTCSGNCAEEPPPPPTPGVPCTDDCHCNGYHLSEFADDPTHGTTHHAQDTNYPNGWCYMFALCGGISDDQVPIGCHLEEVEGITALRYKCQVSVAV